MSDTAARPRILHIHADFDRGGNIERCVRLINAFADADHAIVSGDPARRGAAVLIDPKRKVSWPAFPALSGKPLPGRLKRLAAAMAGYDLICTYNWGAIDAAMAHTLFADVYKLAPLIHHEDRTDEDAAGTKRGRTFYRRIAIGRSAALVVPSRTLERIALDVWQQPRSRVRLIPEGIETRTFAKPPKRDALPGLVKRSGELWVGTLAGSGNVAGLASLIRAFSSLDEPWQLVIAGEGLERETILAEAEACGVEHRVHLSAAGPATVLGLFDTFTLATSPDQSPIPVMQAMAAGLPIAAPRVGDVGAMVASENGPFFGARDDGQELAKALTSLAADPALRQRVGEANRAKARAEYDEATMIDRYRALYWGVMGRR
jgi:glycosyltransferase involved in cell wall biosynthesis